MIFSFAADGEVVRTGERRELAGDAEARRQVARRADLAERAFAHLEAGSPSVRIGGAATGVPENARSAVFGDIMSLRLGPSTRSWPTAPLLNARNRAWSTMAYVPGTGVWNSTIVAPPAGTNVVCTCSCGFEPPSGYTRSKIVPMM